ncbi:DNA polymerase III subunit gamma and tau [Corynebacterium aquilae]|uniref:DNA-directed DNA polymerase n=1 Tax=Corynebacterium aquilae DSM 44791 TaxID=1431546 RepID=A0A1L7CDC0_9CORY|nr:hypothetical protein CAQU_00680 [Corynebacterium aquilae DSM 44791]
MALYRKYRPATFSDVVGQDHVTKPLSTALDSGRINHAYLFSGPRGCGKTSSARIMARSLNCVQGPTSTPCGVCPSCISLAPGGPGNLDVTELDAASHNGVEDMRELRDRAFYAPAESRYRVFIIDEAHMITNAGSNALLKIVEEPPEHLIFIFATTEPEKVIGTIRSRTHHYPFRLLTPGDMRGLLERTCAAEGVTVDPDVYSLVIRAGGGSPRDSLSIMDQLLAGAGPDGLTYDMAIPLLGVTDTTLIDSTINALAEPAADKLYTTINSVIEAGHDPRRFTTDLLDRLRDLMILQTVPNTFELGLVDAPADYQQTLTDQAHAFAPGHLAHLASLVNDGLADMRGATSPRLLLEIIAARMLLPHTHVLPAATTAQQPAVATPTQPAPTAKGEVYVRPSQRAAQAAAQAAARATQPAPAPKPQPAPAPQPQQPQAPTQQAPASPAPAQPAQQAQPAPAQPAPVAQPTQPAQPQAPQASQPAPEPAAAALAAAQQDPQPTPAPSGVEAAPSGATEEQLAEAIAARWIEVRRMVSKKSPVAGVMLTEARVLGVRDNTVVIGHNTGALAARLNAEANNQVLVDVIKAIFGRDMRVHCEVGLNPKKAGFAPAANPATTAQPDASAQPPAQAVDATEPANTAEPLVPSAAEGEQPAAQPVETTAASGPDGGAEAVGEQSGTDMVGMTQAEVAVPHNAVADAVHAAEDNADPAADTAEQSRSIPAGSAAFQTDEAQAVPGFKHVMATPVAVAGISADTADAPAPEQPHQQEHTPHTPSDTPQQSLAQPDQSAAPTQPAVEHAAAPAADNTPDTHPAPPASEAQDTADSGWDTPAPLGGQSAKESADQPAEEPPAPQADAGWDAPRPLGGMQQDKPATTPPPAPAEKPAATESSPVVQPQAQTPVAEDGRPLARWEIAAARGRKALAERPEFSDGVPLPPEPGLPDYDDGFGGAPEPPPEDVPPPASDGLPADPAEHALEQAPAQPAVPAPAPQPQPQPQPQAQPRKPDGMGRAMAAAAAAKNNPSAYQAPVARTQEEEEEEMLAAARAEPGSLDHRDATTVAMELLAEHLGARPI